MSKNIKAKPLFQGDGGSLTPGTEQIFAAGDFALKPKGFRYRFIGGRPWAPYNRKPDTKPPLGFTPEQSSPNPDGKTPGWIPISEEDPQHKHFWETLEEVGTPTDGYYTMVGHLVYGNKFRLPVGERCLIKDGLIPAAEAPKYGVILPNVPRDRRSLERFFKENLRKGLYIDAVVYQHDGQTAEVTAAEFGIERPSTPESEALNGSRNHRDRRVKRMLSEFAEQKKARQSGEVPEATPNSKDAAAASPARGSVAWLRKE